MKKMSIFIKPILLLLLCTVVTSSTYAQFSNTYPYTINSNPTDLVSVDIIKDGAGNTITLATRDQDKIVLTKLDFNGNVVWDEAHTLTSGSGTTIRPTKIIQTLSGFYIVVGLHTDVNNTQNPFAALFNGSGIFTGLFTVYASNNLPGFNSVSGFTRANIVRMQGIQSGAEEYLIVAPGASPYNGDPNITNPMAVPAGQEFDDIVVNAIRIDQRLGEIWNKKYFIDNVSPQRDAMDSQNPSYPNHFIHHHADHPHGLVHVYDNSVSKDKYVITGTTWQILQKYDPFILPQRSPGSAIGLAFNNYYNFVMSIDNNGNELTHGKNEYHGEYTLHYPFGQNQLWDQNTNEVVMSYTIGNTNLASLAWLNPSTIPASCIAVTRFDQNTLNINGGTGGTNTSDYYFFTEATENYAYGIVENEAQSGYVIGAWITDITTHAGMPWPDNINNNISILEIDKTSNFINYYNRFNIFEETITAGITDNFDAGQGMTNYVIAGSKGSAVSTTPNDIRIISTDIGGISCCDATFNTGQGSVTHGSLSDQYNFVVHNIIDPSYNSTFNTPTASTTVDDCYMATDCNYWKPATNGLVNVIESSKVDVYPTILENGNTKLTIAIDAKDATTISLIIYSIDGRKVTEQAYDVNKGSSTYTWNVHLPNAGNYIIKTQSTDEALQGNIRITQL